MRRVLSLGVAVTVAATVITCGAFAAEEKTVILDKSDNTYSTEYNDVNSTKAVLSIYKDGVLVYSTMSEYFEDKYTFEIPDELSGSDARICYVGGEIYDAVLKESTATSTPAATASPNPTQTASPKPEATEKPTRTPYPSVYPRQIDAINAFAVVENVSQTMVDGEEYYTVKMLYQGSEISVNVRTTVKVVSSSDAYKEITGYDARALRDGDVIHFTTDLQGRIESIEFIYRPDFQDYINSDIDTGANFSKLISASGVVANRPDWKVAAYGGSNSGYEMYAFGVPVESKRGSLVLADKAGKIMDVSIDSGTMVYTVSGESRGSKSVFEGNGYNAVSVTYVPRDLYDGEKVSSWEGIEDITYALVRIIDGTATDIVVFIR